MDDQGHESEPRTSREASTDDDSGRASQQGSTGTLLSRPAVWLGTISTVVAIATGMFTLRDQIFPSDAGTAAASTSAYQTSVGEICMGLNQANSALAPNAGNLAKRLASAKTPLAQRDAVLDSWNVVLNSSQYELGLFEGLDVPSALDTRERTTAAAWNRIVARLRGFTSQLDAVSGDERLMAVVLTLPAMERANAADVVARTAGLTELGGGRCELNPPANVQTITLPQLPGASTVGVSVAPAQPMPGHGRAASIVRQRHAHPPKNEPVTPSVTPRPSSRPAPLTITNPRPTLSGIAPVTPDVAATPPAPPPPPVEPSSGSSGGSSSGGGGPSSGGG